jgi:hypothetical protein
MTNATANDYVTKSEVNALIDALQVPDTSQLATKQFVLDKVAELSSSLSIGQVIGGFVIATIEQMLRDFQLIE